MTGSQFDTLVQVAVVKTFSAERIVADCRATVQHHANLVNAAEAAITTYDASYQHRRVTLSKQFAGSTQSATSLDDLAAAVLALRQERSALERALTAHQQGLAVAKRAEAEAWRVLRKLEATKIKREELAQTEQAAETRVRIARAEDDPTW